MSRLTCRRLDLCEDEWRRRWYTVPLDAFYATDHPDVTTIVYVHGNRVDDCEDRKRGLMVYRALLAHCTSEAPIRLLIFSWPTAPDRRPLKDYRHKALLADHTAYPLAWVLDRISPDVRISLVGYSYGTRVIGGALHYLGGGSQCGCVLGERIHHNRIPTRVVFIAAAMDDDGLLPGHRHGLAPSLIDRMLLINNQCDPALKFYHLSSRRCERHCRGRPISLGCRGISSLSCLGEFACRIEQVDACCEVGREHGLDDYLAQSRLTCRVWEYASFQEGAEEQP